MMFQSDAEETPEVVLREQNQRGRRKNRPLSRSLESLNLELTLCKDNASTESSPCTSAAGATSYDDSSLRAKRISQVLTDEGLQAQLKRDSSCIGWDQDMVSSVLGISRVKDAESQGAAGVHGDSAGDNSDVNDDGYCNVMYKDMLEGADGTNDSPYSNVMCKTSPPSTSAMKVLEDSYGDYIKISHGSMTSSSESKDSDNSTYVQLYSKSSVITNQHAHSTENLNDGAQNQSNTCKSQTTGAIHDDSIPNSRSDMEYFQSVSSPTGQADIGVYDNWQVGVCDNMLFGDVSQQQKLAGCGLSGAGASGYLKHSNAAVKTSEFTENCRPVSPDVLQTSVVESSCFDPWVPRESHKPNELIGTGKPPIGKKPMPTPKPTGLGIGRHNSLGQYDRKARVLNKTKPTVFRSNSFSSIDDLDQCGKKEVKGHQRRRSDLLVFSNRSAFLASRDERTVKLDPAITRAVARYATPPREMGPEDVIRDVEESKRRGKVVARYATPPRTLMDPAKLSVLTDGAVIENAYSCEFGTEIKGAYKKLSEMNSPSTKDGERPATIAYDGSTIEGDLWSDIEDYLQHTHGDSNAISPKKSQHDMQRPGSYHGIIHHSTSSPGPTSDSSKPQSPLSSPSSVMSNDSIVGSLKNVVMNITNRITGRSNSRGPPSSGEGSPVRTARASSIGAIDDTKLDSSSKGQKSSKSRDKRKEKRHRFVYQLARAYSDRVKQRAKTIKKRGKSLEDSEMFSTSTKELNNLLQENKQGGNTIGARMADEPCTSVIGTYTLCRHRYTKKKDSCTPDSAQVCLGAGEAESGNNGQDSGYMPNFHDKPLCNPQSNVPSEVYTTLDIPCDSLDHSCDGSDSNEPDTISMDYYYEKKFMDDLEASLTDDMFQDYGMCYEDDCTKGELNNESHSIKLSIKEAVQLIEKKSQPKPVQKTEVKRGEKAQGIQDILKSLEKANGEENKSKIGDEDDETSPGKSVRDRTRELVECARLTRIRQDSYTVVDESNHTLACSDSSGTSTPTRRGYVKSMVEQLQSGQLSNTESESEC